MDKYDNAIAKIKNYLDGNRKNLNEAENLFLELIDELKILKSLLLAACNEKNHYQTTFIELQRVKEATIISLLKQIESLQNDNNKQRDKISALERNIREIEEANDIVLERFAERLNIETRNFLIQEIIASDTKLRNEIRESLRNASFLLHSGLKNLLANLLPNTDFCNSLFERLCQEIKNQANRIVTRITETIKQKSTEQTSNLVRYNNVVLSKFDNCRERSNYLINQNEENSYKLINLCNSTYNKINRCVCDETLYKINYLINQFQHTSAFNSFNSNHIYNLLLIYHIFRVIIYFGIVRFSVDKANECSKSIYSLVNSILCQESRVLSSVLLPQLFFLLSGTLSIYCLTFLMRLQIC